MAKNRVLTEGAFDYTVRKTVNENFSDVSLCTTQFDAVTGTTGTTLTNVVGMVTDSISITPGTYRFQINVHGVATANSGMKLGLKFGTALLRLKAWLQAIRLQHKSHNTQQLQQMQLLCLLQLQLLLE